MTIRRLCTSVVALAACALSCFAQDTVEAINEIKLSGKYFTAEATAASVDEAKNSAFSNLKENIANYCEEMEIEEVGEDKIKANLQQKSVNRGDAVMVLVYVAKTIVEKKEAVTLHPNTSVNTNTTNNNTNSIPVLGSANWPDIIKKVCGVSTFAQLMYLLDMAMDNNLIDSWGKYKSMPNQTECYLVMMNVDRQIVAVLSPVKNDARTDVKTGMVVDSEGMKSFDKCAPICVRVK